jgi:hypothetical protein
MGSVYTFANAIWPIRDVLDGFAFLMAYYAVKMALRFFLGHRAPA